MERDKLTAVAVLTAEAALGLVDVIANRLDVAEMAAEPDPWEVAAFLIGADGAVSIEFVTGDVKRLACSSQAKALLDECALGGAAAARPGARLRRCDYIDDSGRQRSFFAEVNR